MVRRAVALVEVVVATILLGGAIAAIVGMAASAISSQHRGNDMAIAAMLADEQLALVVARGPDEYDKRFGESGTCETPFERFNWSLELSRGSDSEPYAVNAIISWPGRTKESPIRSLMVQTLVASRVGDDPDPDRRPLIPIGRFE